MDLGAFSVSLAVKDIEASLQRQSRREPAATLSPLWAGGLAIAVGVVLWVATTAVSGRWEAWDASLYWTATYPAAIAVAGVLGYLAPQRAWRWGLAIMLAQAVTLTVAASSFGLLPLGLVVFGILAVPPMVAALLAARLRRR
jgi:hypothetical protein